MAKGMGGNENQGEERGEMECENERQGVDEGRDCKSTATASALQNCHSHGNSHVICDNGVVVDYPPWYTLLLTLLAVSGLHHTHATFLTWSPLAGPISIPYLFDTCSMAFSVTPSFSSPSPPFFLPPSPR